MSHPGIIDIHCHLLPGIDDGAKNWDESLRMARQAVAEGIVAAVMTPHQLGQYSATAGNQIRQLTAEFQQHLEGAGIPLQVFPGADVRIDSDMIDRLKSGDCLTLADTGRYVLLELPHELYIPLEPVLEQLNRIGVTGILSHPERNQGLLRQAEIIPRLIAQGCLMQITADSLIGTFGPAPEEFSVAMLQNGWVHFLATDAHSPRNRRPRILEAMRRAESLCGASYARSIVYDNPRAVVAGEACPELPALVKPSLFSRLFRRRAG
jgi:protein-tyrosine phosphatase